MKVSVIIPTYTNTAGLRTLLSSIKQFTDPDRVEVIVIANGAPPETHTALEKTGLNGLTLWFEQPIGFSRACNKGIIRASEDLIVLLNDDCVLLPQERNHWLDLLTQPFADPQVGITGSHKLYDPDTQHHFIIFFCATLRRKMLDQIGTLDESLSPFYGEDIDLCIRAEQAGWKWLAVGGEAQLVLIPDSDHLPEWKRARWVNEFPIAHEGEATLGQLPEHVEVVERNRAKLRAKYRVDIERAKQIEGWMSESELHWLATQAKARKLIVEIGSHRGRSTRALADNTEGVIYAVDYWKDDEIALKFYSNLSDHIASGKVRPVRLSSEDAAKVLNITPDMIFVDGEHHEAAIRADILNWQPLLAEGGLLCGHDYHSDWPDVIKVVDELLITRQPPNTGIWEAVAPAPAQSIKQRPTVTVEVSTLNRYFTTLPITLASIATQTWKPDKLVIYDDGEQRELREIEPYTSLFHLFEDLNIPFETFKTPRLGLAANHQHALEQCSTTFLLRVDDDHVLEPNCIETLLKVMEDETVGAVAPLIHTPGKVQDLPESVNGTVSDVFTGAHVQWYKWNSGPKETEHLHGCYLYRVSAAKAAGGYPKLSPVSHREDTWFSMKIARAGYKLIVTPYTKVHHLQQPSGGIRNFNDGSLWAQDDAAWREWLGVEDKSPKLIVLDNGIGDHWAFKSILPKLQEQHKERGLVVAISHLGILEDTGIPLISIAEARQRLGPRFEDSSLYSWMGRNNWNRSMQEAMLEFWN